MSGIRKWGERVVDKGYSGRAEVWLGLAGEEAQRAYNQAVESYKGVADEYRPYMDLGKTSTSAMQALFASPEGLTSDPFYQARKKETLGAVETSAAAKGKLFSGGTLLELMQKGGEFASAEFDKATARYTTGVNIGLSATQGYDASKANQAEMLIGRGEAGARLYENKASLDAARAQFSSGMFSSWFGGSGPFGQATGGAMKSCYVAAYHFGYTTPEHQLVAEHVHAGKTWRAKLAAGVYWLLKPLFNALLKEAR